MIVERPALERRVLAVIEAGRIPVVLGGCASGRTSLLLRLQQLLGEDRSQYLDFAHAATTPERCLAAVAAVSRLRPAVRWAPGDPVSARAAWDALMMFLDRATARNGQPVFLIDEFLDLRTFENFPGLRQVVREFIARAAASGVGFVLASRFTARTHRLLRDAPARFEVVHVPALSDVEVQALAGRFDAGRRGAAAPQAAAITALTAGRAGYAHLLVEAMATLGAPLDPVAALAALCASDGRLTARCRESYEFRLQRARGYGALKAILGILADDEPQNLTEIAQRLHRTPGSTKDYLSWLEDVDLVVMRGKRYTFDDPLVRLYVRLHARPVPPSDADVVREVRAYAQDRVPAVSQAAAAPVAAVADRVAEAGGASSGIIEID